MSSNVFPLPLSAHIVFVVIAFSFFIIQFVRTKYKYELVLAAAVACTMLIYTNDSKSLFCGVGMIELGLIMIALVSAIVEKHNRKVLAEGEAEADEGVSMSGSDADGISEEKGEE